MASELKVWDGRILKSRGENATNYNFSNLENCRFLEGPYTELQSVFDRDDSRVEKRFPYAEIYTSAPTEGIITDSIRIFNDGCQDKPDNKYYMWKSFSGEKIKVYRDDVYSCEVVSTTGEFCACECGYDRFVPINGPIDGDFSSLEGKQVNDWKTYKYKRKIGEGQSSERQTTIEDGIVGVQGTYTHRSTDYTYEERIVHYQGDSYVDFGWTQQMLDFEINSGGIAIGDYLMAYDTTGGNIPSLLEPNGRGVTTQINVVTGFDNGKVRVANQWTGFFVGNNGLNNVYQTIGTNVKFKRFKDWGDTFGIVTCDGFYHFDGQWFTKTINNPTGECWEQVNNNNGILSFVTRNGYINYGGLGTQQYYFSSLNTRNIGKLTALTTFNNYTVGFTRNSLTVLSYGIDQTTGVSGQVFDTDATRGIRSRDAYSVSIEGLKIIDSEKNFVYITLEPTNFGTFRVKMEDRSDGIRTHLKKIRKGDNVSITEDGDEIRIIIQGRYKDGKYQSKTKMLIFDKFQRVRHIHTTGLVIKRKSYDEFLGDNIYTNKAPGFRDGSQFTGATYTQKVEAMLYSDKQKTLFNYVTLKKLLFSVGNRIRTNTGHTKFIMSANNGQRKPIYELDDITDVEYIRNINNVILGRLVKPTEDAKLLLANCGSYNDKCDGDIDKKAIDWLDDREDVFCNMSEERIFEDYGVCIDDKKHYLSEMSVININVPMGNDMFHGYHIKIEADGVDSFHTGGFMGEYNIYAIGDKNLLSDNQRECVSCKKGADCPECDTLTNHPDAECKTS